jgi:hypothetical protein
MSSSIFSSRSCTSRACLAAALPGLLLFLLLRKSCFALLLLLAGICKGVCEIPAFPWPRACESDAKEEAILAILSASGSKEPSLSDLVIV